VLHRLHRVYCLLLGITEHLRRELSQVKGFDVCSADTLLRMQKELATEKETINNYPIYIENRNGNSNSNVKYKQAETLKRHMAYWLSLGLK